MTTGQIKNTEFSTSSTHDLLQLYTRVLNELRKREVIRSSNNPVAGYSELLFCLAFGWAREGNSKAGHDASDGTARYQIKGRYPTVHNASQQLLGDMAAPFPLPHGRGDELHNGGSPDPHGMPPKLPTARDIYLPELHIDTLILKPLNFH